MIPELKKRFRRLQQRLDDPLLTVLTILFALFVIAPFHAARIFASEEWKTIFPPAKAAP